MADNKPIDNATNPADKASAGSSESDRDLPTNAPSPEETIALNPSPEVIEADTLAFRVPPASTPSTGNPPPDGQATEEMRTVSLRASQEGVSGDGVDAVSFDLDPSSSGAYHSRIAHFEVLSTLGSGGFGVVLRARDTQLDREVAIKIIKSSLVGHSDRMRRQFKEEAKAAAQLRHPNIVPVYQSGDLGVDQTYIVFDYIQGETLRRRLRRMAESPISVRDAVRLLVKIADALGYAHSKGIVHRDVKPENILIDSDAHEPHVADFGCARRHQFDTSEDEAPSRGLEFVGTPPYFSPEQASGKSDRADARADVWALGVIMDEMLSSKRTFASSEKDRDRLFSSIAHEQPVPLRERAPGVDRDLNAIWACCLAKDRKARYRSGYELSEDLERWLRHQPVSVRPLGLVERAGRWSGRNPIIATLLATVFLAVSLGFGVSSYFWHREVEAQREHVATQLTRLESADPRGVEEILRAMSQPHLLPVAVEELRRRLDVSANKTTPTLSDARIALALNAFAPQLNADPPLLEQTRELVVQSALDTNPDELTLMCRVLTPITTDRLLPDLRRSLLQPEVATGRKLRTLCLLLALDPDLSSHLDVQALASPCLQWLQAEMLASGQADVAPWLPMLSPLRDPMRLPLEASLASDQGAVRQRSAAILFDLFADDINYLTQQLLDVDDELVNPLLRRLANAVRHANSGSGAESEFIANLRRATQVTVEAASAAGDGDDTSADVGLRRGRALAREWLTLLYVTPRQFIEAPALFLDEANAETLDENPTSKSLFVSLAATYGVSRDSLWQAAMERAARSDDLAATMPFLMALGKYEPPSLDQSEVQDLLSRLAYQTTDSGVRAASEWLARQWGLELSGSAVVPPSSEDNPAWSPGAGGTWFVRFPAIQEPITFGSSPTERKQNSLASPGASDYEGERLRTIPWSFEIAAHEVRVGAFQEYLRARIADQERQLTGAEDRQDEERIAWYDAVLSGLDTRLLHLEDLAPAMPVTGISWYEAAAYCVWLSNAEGLASCYGTLDELTDAFQQSLPVPSDLSQPGYRLPTEDEWEVACRAGTRTPWFFGDDPGLVIHYAVCNANAADRPRPVGTLLPNPRGLFDMLGNATEWTNSVTRSGFVPGPVAEEVIETPTSDEISRDCRGGSYVDGAREMRSAARFFQPAMDGAGPIGFRLARTVRSPAAND